MRGFVFVSISDPFWYGVLCVQKMELQALLELNLHTFASDVEEIADQALKEEKMEVALKKLDDQYAGVVFVSSPYKEGSDVLLLAISEEDFDL